MTKVGIGNTAEVFDYEDGKVCKLFFQGYPKDCVELEFKNAQILFKLGIRVPRPYEIIKMDDRNGIMYEKIDGNTLLECIMKDMTNCADIIEIFMNKHKEILEYHSNDLISYKEFLIAMIERRPGDKEKLIQQIRTLPDGDHVLHGDFHPDNLMMSSDGKIFIIDFMNVCRGPKLYDIARTWFLLTENGQKEFADMYLTEMNTTKNAIEQYLSIIKECRAYE